MKERESMSSYCFFLRSSILIAKVLNILRSNIIESGRLERQILMVQLILNIIINLKKSVKTSTREGKINTILRLPHRFVVYERYGLLQKLSALRCHVFLSRPSPHLISGINIENLPHSPYVTTLRNTSMSICRSIQTIYYINPKQHQLLQSLQIKLLLGLASLKRHLMLCSNCTEGTMNSWKRKQAQNCSLPSPLFRTCLF